MDKQIGTPLRAGVGEWAYGLIHTRGNEFMYG